MTGRFVRAAAATSAVFVALPAVLIVVASFGGGAAIAFPPEELSLQPYADLLGSDAVRAALGRSVVVGVEVVILSILAGVPAALALFRHRVRLRALFAAYLVLGVATPLITSAFAFLAIFTELGVVGSLWPISFAITVVNLPFLVFSVASALAQLDPQLEEAAATLGAEEVQTFLFVTLPALAPGIISGALLVFVLGISEFLLSLMLSTIESQTLPVVIFSGLRGAVPPALAAAAGIYVLVSLVVVVVITSLRITGAFLYRAE